MIEVIVNLVPQGYRPKTETLYRIAIGNHGSTGGYDVQEHGYTYRVIKGGDVRGPVVTSGDITHLRSKNIFSLLAHLFVSLLDTRHLEDYLGGSNANN